MIAFAPTTRPDIKRGEVGVFVRSIYEGLRRTGVFVEIGVRHAHSTAAILEEFAALGHARHLYSIDATDEAEREHANVARRLAGASRATFLKRLSYEIAPEFEEPIAWLFVDGCHCYACVLGDVEGWAPKIVVGGMLVLHDTGPQLGARSRDRCFRTGKVELARVDRAIAASGALRSDFELVEKAEGGGLLGIRAYRRVR